MAYSGFLVKIGDYTIKDSVIRLDSYKAYPGVLDLDSYRDANGLLHRNVLSHVPCKCEFSLRPMTESKWEDIMSNIRANYTITLERKGNVTMYIPEYCDYITQEAYMAEPQPTIYTTSNGRVVYKECKISFIGY